MSGSILDRIANPTIAQINPLDNYAKALSVNNALNQNKLFQARQAIGQAYQQATNPDGTIDPARASALIAQNPNAALGAADDATANQALRVSQQKRSIEAQTSVNAGIASLLALPDSQQNAQTYQSRIDAWAKGGAISPQDAQAATSDMPQGAAANDPAAWRQYGLRHLIHNMATPEQAATLYGSNVRVDNGQTIQGGVQASPVMGGALNVGGKSSVQKQTGPETNADLVEIQDPDGPPGQMKKVPRNLLPGASGISGGSSAFPNGGRNAPPATAQPGSPGVVSKADPNLVAKNAADTTAYQADMRAIPQGQQNVQSLQKAQIALEASNTGRSSEGVHNMLATMQTLGIPTLGMADDVASYDLAHKYLLDYARKSGAAAHSDLQLQSSEGANASTGISNQAALDVVHTNIGRERQAIAQAMEAPDKTGRGYTDHGAKFSTATDPRGFAIDAYSPAQRDKMIAGMTPTERTKFYKSVGIASRLGLLNPQQ